MLREIWQSLLTPAPGWARRSGLLYEAVSLEARYRRCRVEWDAHYARCQGVIEQAAAQADCGGTVVILGSGLARDIPLGPLSARFERVILVDAVHMRAARRASAGFPGVVHSTHDLSARLDPRGGPFHFPADTRLAVSLNLLGQLPLPLGVGEGAARTVIEEHLALLRQAPLSCLISDILWLDERQDGIVERRDPWLGVAHPPGLPLDCWDWMLAPPGELGGKRVLQHRVCAWLLEGGPVARHPLMQGVAS
ncbi:MAG: hypothetical protein ACOZAQ_03840 [Pseudomonadota bacterium]